MGFLAVSGLVLSALAAVAAALLVWAASRRSLPLRLRGLPLCLLAYSAWMTSWFFFETLRAFLLTRLEPPTAIRLVGFVLLLVSVSSVVWFARFVLFVCRALRETAAGGLSRAVFVLATAGAALLTIGWGVFQATGDSGVFLVLRESSSRLLYPGSLAVSLWLLVGGRRQADAAWRWALSWLGICYVVIFGGLFGVALGWDVLSGLSPVVPTTCHLTLGLAYLAVSYVWGHRRLAGVGLDRSQPPAVDR